MNHEPMTQETVENEGRRGFIKMLGAGLLITVSGDEVLAQQQRGGRRGGGGKGGKGGGRGGFGGGGPQLVSARLHIGADGAITVLTGKVEEGQGARGEITQAAAEELKVRADQIHLVMADFPSVPNDGTTAGSGTTPRTIPGVRQACAAARKMLVELACLRWSLKPDAVEVKDGVITDKAGGRKLTYGELAQSQEAAAAMKKSIPADVTVTPVKEWQILGTSLPRPNIKDIFMGAHKYPSDTICEGMLYGKVLRAPSYGATLASIDLAPAKAFKNVIAVRDGDFVGCVAPTSYRAQQAVEAIAKTAQWQTVDHVSSKDLFKHLKAKAGGGLSKAAPSETGKTLTASYEVAYIQHTPLEPRTATAEWSADGHLTVWTGSSNPASVHGELARQFNIPADKVRVIVPDMGGGYGGKHTGEAALEAARLAKAAGKPVNLRWTRAEEFTWAYFRPAGVIETRATLDAKGALIEWEMVNINSGGSAVASPYKIPKNNSRPVGSDSPLRQSSYRALASTANNFARESFMDELAAAAGIDPLAFRLAHLEDPRLKSVLEAAAKKFGWAGRKGKGAKDTGIGLSCGTEKNSVVAACAEVSVDRAAGKIKVLRVVQAFECGTVLNPSNMQVQVEGCIIMGLGGALTEEIQFEGGKILNASLDQYQVPRFKDVPPIEVVLMNWPEMSAVGGGETPIIAIAPAIANAVFNATGLRIRSMPMRLPAEKKA